MKIRAKTLDATATYVVLLASGNPTIQYFIGKEAVLFGVPALLGVYALIRGISVRRIDFLVISAFVMICVGHYWEFGAPILPSGVGFLLKLIAAMLLVRTVVNFPGTYVRVLFWLAVVSLFFYVPQLLITDTVRVFVQPFSIPMDGALHIGVHNFGPEIHAHRNSGMFWEPGAFAGYLVLAILFCWLARESDVHRAPKYVSPTLFVALITTQSTTGYVACCLLALGAVLKFGIRNFFRVVLLGATLLVASYSLYETVPFLADKINAQVEATLNKDERSEITRFGNAFYDWDFIRQRPLLGWSASEQTRISVDSEVEDFAAAQGNGLTGTVVRFGVFGFMIFAIFVYRAFFSQVRSHGRALVLLAVVLTLLIGEQFLNFPLFLALMFGWTPALHRGTKRPNFVGAPAVSAKFG